ncbi:MAG TPA: c-type cytochrome [Anaerolineaceae bacterium]|nr:c-type cytochrome [Anaerolineaceae bacterium]
MFKKFLKWFGIVLGSLVGLLALAAIVLYLIGSSKLNKKYDVPVEAISVPADAHAVEHGKHLATIFMCTSCHTANLSGQVYFVVPGMVNIPTPNLTAGAGGAGATFSDQDFVRAIRHGVDPEGRALFIMPVKAFHNMSDADMGAVIAYVRSLPPVDHQLPEVEVDPLGRLMMGAGMFPPFAADQIDHTSPPPPAPAAGATAAYGQYLSHICEECHGANLNGAPFGPPGQEVPTPNLTPGGDLAGWSEQDFITTLRTGTTPSGKSLKEEMPWKSFGQMTDDELKALWMYIHSLPALPQGK